jgi:hypothetical protein
MSDICTNPTLQSPLNIASKDKFVMVLNLPYVLRKQASTDPSIDIEPFQISIFGAIVPEIRVPEIDVRFAGQNFHLTSYARPNYPPLNVNFVVDNEYKNYYLLWKWLDIKNLALEDYYGGSSSLTNEEQAIVGNQFEYQTDFSIFALNEYNEKVIEFKYYKAFVSALGAINYSYRDGEILESSAEFAFSQLEVIKHFPKTNIKKQSS